MVRPPYLPGFYSAWIILSQTTLSQDEFSKGEMAPDYLFYFLLFFFLPQLFQSHL